MRNDLAGVEHRLRAAYRAVAATTELGVERRVEPAPPPGPRRPPRLVAASITLAVLAACAVAALVLRDSDGPSTTEVATLSTSTSVATTPASSPEPTCGAQLPRPLDLPEGYRGPERVASSVEGQLVLRWTSSGGSIDVRWPADPSFGWLLGRTIPATSDGGPSVAGSGTTGEITETAPGRYSRTIVFDLRNVPPDCRALQVDVIDADPARVDAGAGRLANKGLFVSNVPLVVGSEDRAMPPTVIPCNAPAGVAVPPKRGGPVTGAAVHPAPTDALKAFLDTDSSLIPNQYLEIRLPDGSIAYAKEQWMRPGAYVTVVHVVRIGSGWSVDRWEASGC